MVIGAPVVISAIVTVTVEDGTGAVKTSRQHVQRKTDNLYPPHVIYTMMFQTIRHYASHVRADVVIGASIVTSVIVIVNAEEVTSAAETSRRHVQMNTNKSSQLYVIHMMMFLIMKLCVNPVRADVVIDAPIVTSVIVIVNAEVTNAAETSRRHVQMTTNNSSRCHVIHMMMLPITKLCVNPVRADVVIGAPIVTSVIVIVNAEVTNAAETFRRHVLMSTNNLILVRVDAVRRGMIINVIVTVNVEHGTDVAKISMRYVHMNTNNSSRLHVIHVMMFQITKQNVPCVSPLMRFQMTL